MTLIIGGAHQGKLNYALAQTNLTKAQVTQGSTCSVSDVQNIVVLNGLHRVIKRLIQQGDDPHAYVERLLVNNPEVIIITDEIGCGVVPLERFERDWRETTGRICCSLAQNAQRVERVFCGIATVLKGESL